ncbi:hypothetical protein GCM10022255_035210 [Dactylosporangium darangshiense]|uniref:Uncharacterized protein n=1 Tax=Dactylosporangium darangshiense TaxID=579108 RepID=A0ABP8D884_9ACTN
MLVADPLQPSFLTRLRAGLAGERDTVYLEALRAAGRVAYDEMLAADELRERLPTLWNIPVAPASQLLAAWNAFVLQTLGETFLDADYAAQPATAGYVPPVTFDQAAAWLTAVGDWVSWARQARANPELDLALLTALPAPLPAWAEVITCPPVHLAALQAAVAPVREHAEVALHALVRQGVPPQFESAVHRLHQDTAAAAAAVEYAAGLRTGRHHPGLHELIEQNLKRALELWYRVGQLASMPSLLSGPRFDVWCMTDRATLSRWRNDPRACQAVLEMWRGDPNPAATLAIQSRIDAGLRAGDLWYHVPRFGDTCYFEPPFSSLYEVRRPIRIAGIALRVQTQFAVRGGVNRGLVLGPFRPTERVRYRVA